MSPHDGPADQAMESTAFDQRGNRGARRSASILIVDDEAGICSFLQRALAKEYALVETAESIEVAEGLCERCHFDLFIVDVRLPGRSGIEWLQSLREQNVRSDVILMTAYGDLDTAVSALRAGASDFLLKPFRTEQMLSAVRRCLDEKQQRRESFVFRRQVDHESALKGMVGDSAAIKEVCEVIQQVAPTPATVLIEGESGTGKELAAHVIHKLSERTGAFVPVNCAAMSPELMESELFGHTKGAFTGAHQAREGLFSYANGGTLFLDEIGEMPLGLQAKLLRVIEQRSMRPVGANHEVQLDVRLVTATNRDIEADVENGRFRQDLYYRLSVLGMRMPALRERREDIPALVQYFVGKLADDLRCDPIKVDPHSMEQLKMHEWPGNVRELKNVIERATLLGRQPHECISVEANTNSPDLAPASAPDRADRDDALALDEVERRHILRMLDAAHGNKSEAARRLGISRKTLERKLAAWTAQAGGAPQGD